MNEQEIQKLHKSNHSTYEQEMPKVYTIRDSKAGYHGAPIVYQTRGIFIRDIQKGLAKGQDIWAQHPEDFGLYEIGEYNPRTAKVLHYDEADFLGLVQDYRQSLDQTLREQKN